MAQDRKRGDIVASPRSRLEKEKKDKPIKTGADAQQEFVDMIDKLFSTINAQLEVTSSMLVTLMAGRTAGSSCGKKEI